MFHRSFRSKAISAPVSLRDLLMYVHSIDAGSKREWETQRLAAIPPSSKLLHIMIKNVSVRSQKN